jgi:integrase
MGLRLGEGLRLQVGDIDENRMRVHIRNAKGNKDRFVPLPSNTLTVLRRFWQLHQHPTLLFPNRKGGLKNAHLADSHLNMGGVQVTMAAVVREMGLKKHRFLLLQNLHTPHPCGKDFLPFSETQLRHALARAVAKRRP